MTGGSKTRAKNARFDARERHLAGKTRGGRRGVLVFEGGVIAPPCRGGIPPFHPKTASRCTGTGIRSGAVRVEVAQNAKKAAPCHRAGDGVLQREVGSAGSQSRSRPSQENYWPDTDRAKLSPATRLIESPEEKNPGQREADEQIAEEIDALDNAAELVESPSAAQ